MKISGFLVFFCLFALPLFAASNSVQIREDNDYIYITSNGIPDHTPGRFPNSGNPNTISAQNYSFRVTKHPRLSGSTRENGMNDFGVALNGVPFDPGANEYWNNDRASGWTYEALSGKVNLGMDQNNAHVQPNGAYHYHGIPKGFVHSHGSGNSPVLVGYASDGFPIYHDDHHKSSYRVKSGIRPSGPGGRYDGTFVQDYEYARGLGDLDECNGMTGPTREYPDGIYHYYLTDDFPFVPRCLKGTPDPSFQKGGPGGGRGGQRQSSGPGQSEGAGNRGGFSNPGGAPGGMRGGGPPQEAIAACQGARANDSCTVQTPHGTLQGTCRTVPEGVTACVPSRR